MKKIVILLALLILGSIGLIFYSNNFRSVLNLKTDFDSSRVSPISPEDLPQHLSLPSGFKLTFFAKFSSAPRVLVGDGSNTIFVSLPESGKITALINTSNKEQPDQIKDVVTSLNNPHGIAYYNNKLFIAEENQVSRYDWNKKTYEAKLEKVLFQIPDGGNHRSRSIAFDNNGRMYVSIGSTCNVCVENDPWRASVIISDFEGSEPKRFASGLRNTVFMVQNPNTGEMWGADMGRDYLGDNLPPDEINIIKNNTDYGWPYCYAESVRDDNFIKQNELTVSENVCRNSTSPIFQIPAHSSPLGLAFVNSTKYPANLQNDLLVAYHGSWNSSVPKGYKVVRLKLNNNNNVIYSEDFITGYIQDNIAIGRPVALTFDSQGNLFLSDDKANAVYKITYLP